MQLSHYTVYTDTLFVQFVARLQPSFFIFPRMVKFVFPRMAKLIFPRMVKLIFPRTVFVFPFEVILYVLKAESQRFRQIKVGYKQCKKATSAENKLSLSISFIKIYNFIPQVKHLELG